VISEIFCLLNAFIPHLNTVPPVAEPDYEVFLVFLRNKRWDDLPRCGVSAPGEESPDRTGHPTEESSDGSNLMTDVTENNRLETGKGENVR